MSLLRTLARRVLPLLAVGGLGLAAASPASAAPTAPIIKSAPAPYINTTTAEVAFELQAGQSAECMTDAQPGEYQACSSPLTLANLEEGSHYLFVRAVAGGERSPSALVSFTVDLTGPAAAPGITGPDARSSRTTAQLFVTKPQGLPPGDGAAIDCALDDQGWAPCSTSVQYEGLALGAHSFRARLLDRAGNPGPAAVHTWEVVEPTPTPPPPPTPTPTPTPTSTPTPPKACEVWSVGWKRTSSGFEVKVSGRRLGAKGGSVLLDDKPLDVVAWSDVELLAQTARSVSNGPHVVSVECRSAPGGYWHFTVVPELGDGSAAAPVAAVVTQKRADKRAGKRRWVLRVRRPGNAPAKLRYRWRRGGKVVGRKQTLRVWLRPGTRRRYTVTVRGPGYRARAVVAVGRKTP